MKEDYEKCSKCKTIRNKTLSDICVICKDKKIVNEMDDNTLKEIPTYHRKKIIEVAREEIDIELKKYIKTLASCIKDKSRTRENVQERVQAICNLRNVYKLSYPKIAKILNYSDHTTCVYHFHKYCK